MRAGRQASDCFWLKSYKPQLFLQFPCLKNVLECSCLSPVLWAAIKRSNKSCMRQSWQDMIFHNYGLIKANFIITTLDATTFEAEKTAKCSYLNASLEYADQRLTWIYSSSFIFPSNPHHWQWRRHPNCKESKTYTQHSPHQTPLSLCPPRLTRW